MKKRLIKKIFMVANLIFLCGCEKDLYDTIITKDKINVEHISLKKSIFKKFDKENLLRAVERVQQIDNIHSKIIFDSVKNIYFDDDSGIKISNQETTTYNFKIYKEGADEKLQNVVFNLNLNGDYDAYLIKYNFSEKDFQSFSNNEITSQPIEIESLFENSAPRLIVIDTMIWVEYPIDHGDLTGNNGYTGHWVTVSSTSGNTGPPGSSNSSGEHAGGQFTYVQGNGSGYSGSVNILTSPVHGSQEINHILKLYQLTQINPSNLPSNIVRNKLNAFKNSIKTVLHEEGAEYKFNGIVNGLRSYAIVLPNIISNSYVFFGPLSANTAVRIHTHQENYINSEQEIAPVFSDDDLFKFSKEFKELTILN